MPLKGAEVSCALAPCHLILSLTSLQLQDRSFEMQTLLAPSWINSDGEGGQVCCASVHTSFVPPCAGMSTEPELLEGCQRGEMPPVFSLVHCKPQASFDTIRTLGGHSLHYIWTVWSMLSAETPVMSRSIWVYKEKYSWANRALKDADLGAR